MRLIFMGTPAFALPSLELLRERGYIPAAVVTRPDRPRGRGNRLFPPPVKEWACKHNVAVLQPERLRDLSFMRRMEAAGPDLIVTAAYGCLLPGELLDLPPLGCINLHASLLPAYRGAAPIHRAVMDGANETGVTVMRMALELDAGDIILQQREPIYSTDTTGSLHDRLAESGAKLLLRAVEELKAGAATYTPQDPKAVSCAAPLKPGEERIDWRRAALALHNQVRGMNPWPGAYTTFSGKRLKIWKTEPGLAPPGASAEPGTVLEITDRAVLVSAGEGALALLNLQPQGKRPMPAADFCRGYRVEPGWKLGGESREPSLP